jgi:hypothetical protein
MKRPFGQEVVHMEVLAALVVLLATLLTMLPPLRGQTVNSMIEGLVTDSTGAVIPGAAVVLTNVDTHVAQTTETNDAGRYAYPSVPPGLYSLKVSKQGFESYLLDRFKVVVAQRPTENVVLKVGSIAQLVTVTAGGLAPLLERHSNEVDTLIEPTTVSELPLNGRNFLQLGVLSGTATDSGTDISDFVAIQGGHPGRSINITGLPQDLTMYLINGMATAGSRINHAELDLSIAAIDQFNVRTGFFLPGLGADPGIVNVITKSGSNSFHGEAFEFLRNNKLDARGFFDTVPPPPFHRNQFGFALGGPILKDRLFFFGNYEGLRQVRTDQGRGFAPSAKMFEGDFSELLPNTLIYDPLTFDPATGKRQAFLGNIIPPDRINSVAKNLLPFYRPGSSFSPLPFNLFSNVSSRSDSDQYTVRIDSNLSPRNALFGQFTRENSPVVRGGLFPLQGTSWPLNTKLAMLQWTATLSPTLVNELRVGWTRGLVFQEGESKAGVAPQVGIPGTADPNGIPTIALEGFDAFGNSNGLLGNIDNLYQIHDSLNYLRGNHQMQLGFDLRYARSIQQSANATARGIVSFHPVFSAQLQTGAQGQLVPVPGTGNSFADFLLGRPTDGQVLSMPRSHFRWTQFEPYFQDSWKVRRGLTLNYGLSWYLATPPNPVGPDKKFPHVVDLRTGQVLFAALGQIDPEVIRTQHNNVTPRIGLAWEPSFAPNTVVRAGWGVYYASQRLLDQQFSIIAPGVTLSQAFLNSTSNPLPQFVLGNNVFPPISLTPITQQFAQNIGGVIFDLNPSNRTGYVEQWNVSIQHTVGQRNLLELDYIGNEAHKLDSRFDVNSCARAGSLQCDPANIPFSQFPFILFSTNDGNSNYQAFIAKFQRQFSDGLSVLANYTWSKVLTNSMEAGAGGTLSEMGGACRKCDKGLAGFNVPQRLVISPVYELPFGRGKALLSGANTIINQVVDGWEVNTIASFSKGNPFEILAPNTTSAIFSDFRANRLCNGRDSLSNKNLRTNGLLWFDPKCFAPPSPGFFGTSGFDILTGPGTNNWDIGIAKNATIHESLHVQFRAESFNAFNHAQFQLGSSIGTADPKLGRVRGARVGREIQFGLKLLW